MRRRSPRCDSGRNVRRRAYACAHAPHPLPPARPRPRSVCAGNLRRRYRVRPEPLRSQRRRIPAPGLLSRRGLRPGARPHDHPHRPVRQPASGLVQQRPAARRGRADAGRRRAAHRLDPRHSAVRRRPRGGRGRSCHGAGAEGQHRRRRRPAVRHARVQQLHARRGEERGRLAVATRRRHPAGVRRQADRHDGRFARRLRHHPQPERLAAGVSHPRRPALVGRSADGAAGADRLRRRRLARRSEGAGQLEQLSSGLRRVRPSPPPGRMREAGRLGVDLRRFAVTGAAMRGPGPGLLLARWQPLDRSIGQGRTALARASRPPDHLAVRRRLQVSPEENGDWAGLQRPPSCPRGVPHQFEMEALGEVAAAVRRAGVCGGSRPRPSLPAAPMSRRWPRSIAPPLLAILARRLARRCAATGHDRRRSTPRIAALAGARDRRSADLDPRVARSLDFIRARVRGAITLPDVAVGRTVARPVQASVRARDRRGISTLCAAGCG